jgi:hypothetical protein
MPISREVPSPLRPKKPQWFRAFLWIAAASLAIFTAVAIVWGWSPAEPAGLAFGIAAAALMVLEVLYALRRRLRIRPLNTGQRWLQAHVYGGSLAAIYVLIHTGFGWPHGTFGLVLWLLTLVVTASGLLGVFAQKLVPPTLSNTGVEAIYERIPELVAELRAEATAAVAGASDRLQRFYGSNVQPALGGPSLSWSYLVDMRSDRDRRVAEFESLRSFVDDADRERLEHLQTVLVKKIELEAHYTWQTVLRWWLFVHVPAAMLLIAAVVAHVIAVIRF